MEELSLNFIFQFMLVFARLASAVRRFPALGSPYIHNRVKLFFVLTSSFVMMPILKPFLPTYNSVFIINVGYIILEVLIGFIISFAANIYFMSLHIVGQILSMQSALGAAAFFDPTQKSQVTIFSNFMLVLATAMVFASNTHHLLINAVVESYIKFPPGDLINSADIGKFISFVINDSFILAFKLVSPVIIVSLSILTGSGLLARLMPNLQVFFVITPAQILIMFCTMYIVMNSLISKIIASVNGSMSVIG